MRLEDFDRATRLTWRMAVTFSGTSKVFNYVAEALWAGGLWSVSESAGYLMLEFVASDHGPMKFSPPRLCRLSGLVVMEVRCGWRRRKVLTLDSALGAGTTSRGRSPQAGQHAASYSVDRRAGERSRRRLTAELARAWFGALARLTCGLPRGLLTRRLWPTVTDRRSPRGDTPLRSPNSPWSRPPQTTACRAPSSLCRVPPEPSSPP